MALHARPYVAGEAVEHVLVLVLHAPADRDHVAHPAVLRVERRHDVIEERPLVEIGVVRVGLEREQQPSELQHVVDVARLAGAAIDHVAEFVGGAEVLILAVTAGGEAMMLRHLIPEETRGQEIGRGAGVDEALHRSEQLGDLGVAVRTAQVVLVALQRLDERPVLELVREPEPALVTRVGVQVGHHFVHAAEFGIQHVLDLRVVEPRENPLRPRRELDLDGERGGVTRVAVRVAQARVHLVQGVPRGPFPVQVEGSGADFAAGEGRERLAPSLERREVAVAVGVLHGREFPDDVCRALFEPGVAGGRPHQADGRQVMTGDVPGEIAAAAVPPAVRLRLGRQAGALPIIGQHAVGLEREQVLSIELLRVLERAAGQADGGQRECASTGDGRPQVVCSVVPERQLRRAGLSPACAQRRVSYELRGPDESRGPGYIVRRDVSGLQEGKCL